MTIWYYSHYLILTETVMLPKPIVAALLAALLSAGCAVGPDYVWPDVAMPQYFQGQSAVEQRRAAAS